MQASAVSDRAVCEWCIERELAQDRLSLMANVVQTVEQPAAEWVPECRGLG